MTQLAIDFDAPPLAIARAVGEVAMQRVLDHAERTGPGFSERARAFVLLHLQAHGPSSGEAITDAAKRAGITPPDDRAFGPVYAALSRANRIAVAGFVARRKGHGTAGGRLWRLVHA